MEARTQTISKSGKNRYPKRRVYDSRGAFSHWEKEQGSYPTSFKQVVVKTPIGKNKKGVMLYHSQTHHLPD